MPTLAELPWYMIVFLPTPLPPFSPPIIPWYPASVISYTVLHYVKKHEALPNLPSIPSQTSRAGAKPSRGANISKWYHLGHWFKKAGKDIRHWWRFIWKQQGEGFEWKKDMQYPRPGDVNFYPLRPDLNPYLDPKHPQQPQISTEQATIFEQQAKEMFRFIGDGTVPGKLRIKYDDWRRRDRCSGRNLIWEYLRRGDGSVGGGLEKCVGYVRLLMDHSCAVTVNGTICTGFHPSKDLNYIRYAYPNNTWYGLGDPLSQRPLNATLKLDDPPHTTGMYTIDIGNGTVINLGIDRDARQNEINATALAEGTLPEGVELYGPGWRSEYDVDDDEDAGKSLGKRSQLVDMSATEPKRYASLDLTRYKLSQEQVGDILKSRQDHIFEKPMSSSENGILIDGISTGKLIGPSVGIAVLVFLSALFGLLILRKRSARARKGGIVLGDRGYDGDNSEVNMTTYVESGTVDCEEFGV